MKAHDDVLDEIIADQSGCKENKPAVGNEMAGHCARCQDPITNAERSCYRGYCEDCAVLGGMPDWK